MRAARLISLVLLLQNRESMTAAELARRLEVSERTIARDVLALAEAGVPVYADRGRGGGYRLLEGYRTRLTGLGRAEAEALFLSGVPGPLRDMGLGDAALAARLKVSAALLPELRDAPATAAQRFHLDAPAWFRVAGRPPLLPELSQAVWGDRVATVRYRRGEQVVDRTLEPYGLVLKAGVWYAVARTSGDTGGGAGGRFLVYRVDRFEDVRTGTERFVRDEGFDLAAFWDARAEDFERSLLRTQATVRLTPAGLRTLRHVADPAALPDAMASASAPDGHGRVTVVLPVESVEVAYSQILRLGPEAEVLDPPELRALLSDAAVRMHRLYDPQRRGSSSP
ncbi:helix-turn-helix transcriptional regulator [Actinoallomurus rhizosphaericola]|uniref:helix-turn-helix transcriptional regulator n=1 Tax=Actinoallomurus rhizosphaericola TaxID=2952536 RepID=UPI002091DB94|nr:WYL domain-containing protein [Actinoallomurus rhizosphaericola]MCO5992058.1 WYL domain-containing protein [Actinoallomurus rhizosphaericola]